MKKIIATDKAPAAIGPYSQGTASCRSIPLRALLFRAALPNKLANR